MEVQKGEYTKCNWARLIGFEVPRESFRNRQHENHLRDYDERKDHKNLVKKKFKKSRIRLMFRLMWFYVILCLDFCVKNLRHKKIKIMSNRIDFK